LQRHRGLLSSRLSWIWIWPNVTLRSCENLQLVPKDGMAVEMHLDAGKDLIIRRDVNVWSSPA
jgi:hypothetical protein